MRSAAFVLCFAAYAATASADVSLPGTLPYMTEGHSTPHVLDIAVIGDKYPDMNTFRRDAERFKSTLLAYEPFKSHANEIYFHFIENTVDLGCRLNITTGLTGPAFVRSCNMNAVDRALRKTVVPADKLLILVNGMYGGNGNTMYAIAGNVEDGFRLIPVHELGHTFGLLDEYAYTQKSPVVDDKCSENCCHSSACTDWKGVAGTSCVAGCTYSNWYRSSKASIMSSPTGGEAFNAVSQKIIATKIEQYTNTVLPSVSITSPKDGSAVSGSVEVEATAKNTAPSVSVSKMEIYADGKLIDTYTYKSAFYQPENSSQTVTMRSHWNTASLLPRSRHTLFAKAYDLAGNVATSRTVSVTLGAASSLISSAASSLMREEGSVESNGTPPVIPSVSEMTATSSSARLTRTLWRGEKGDDVSALQTFLKDEGVYPDGPVTGYFGPLTEAAVQRFQAANGIVSAGEPESTGYGVVGPRTRARLNALMN